MNVALFIYNRPQLATEVLRAIRHARPSKLFVIADGPDPSKPYDADLTARARGVVKLAIDWPCDVRMRYASEHLGCKAGPLAGYNWVFGMVDECIFLEDDCVPHPSFFPYCEELLDRFRNDTRVMAISGNSFQDNLPSRTPHSYHFSGLFHAWGWATWKRAWDLYDANMRLWPTLRSAGWLWDIWANKALVQYWTHNFDLVSNGLDAWDYQFAFACQVNNGLCVTPSKNLVTNIGFGPDATHTRTHTKEANLPVCEMPFPLNHPPYMIRDRQADDRELPLLKLTELS